MAVKGLWILNVLLTNSHAKKLKNADVKVRMNRNLYPAKAMFEVHKSPFKMLKKILSTIELWKLDLIACS